MVRTMYDGLKLKKRIKEKKQAAAEAEALDREIEADQKEVDKLETEYNNMRGGRRRKKRRKSHKKKTKRRSSSKKITRKRKRTRRRR